MLFSLGQVLGLLCNPRNLLRKHHRFPVRRPSDAKESRFSRKASLLPSHKKRHYAERGIIEGRRTKY